MDECNAAIMAPDWAYGFAARRMTAKFTDDARYHGGTRRPFFEGWYFKHAGKDGAFAAIPGVFHGKNRADNHAFIQVLFSSPPESHFVRFPAEVFSCDSRSFMVRIADNMFSLDGCRLSLPGIGLEASFQYGPRVPLNTSLISPTIMGPFAYLPGMQCRHGVLSLWHSVTGSVRCGGRRMDFDGADGYIEKDWGSAFPDSWVWMQCGDSRVTLMCAVASIPLKLISFTGIICVLRDGNKQYRLATYNGARVSKLEWQGRELLTKLSQKYYRLTVRAQAGAFGHLQAPTPTGMDRRIQESLETHFFVRLEHRGETVLQGYYTGGLEMLNVEELMK
ncbi:MAG: tocopherol cyclase family protein [Christensenellales bacterium]|jgi:tocopherol cyclase